MPVNEKCQEYQTQWMIFETATASNCHLGRAMLLLYLTSGLFSLIASLHILLTC